MATDTLHSDSEQEEDHNLTLASHNKKKMMQGDSLLTSAFASLGSESVDWKELGGSMRSGSGLLGQGLGGMTPSDR